MLPRNPVDPPGRGILLVAADQHSPRLVLAVDEVVGVAKARAVPRDLVPLHRLHQYVLVLDRHRRQPRADHLGHLGRPDARGIHHVLGVDPPPFRQHRSHLMRSSQLDRAHACAGHDLHAERTRSIRDRVCRDVRIDVTVLGHPHPAVQRAPGSERKHGEHLAGSDQLCRQPQRGGAADTALQVLERVGTGRDPHAADRVEHAELLIQGHAVAPKAHHRGGRVELRHETCSVMRRAAGQLALVEQHHVAPSRARQVVGHAASHDPASDDDHSCRFRRGHLSAAATRRSSYGGGPAAPRRASRSCPAALFAVGA